jgi:hypothetical protein
MVGMLNTRCWLETKELHLSSSILPKEMERGSPETGEFDQLDALPKNAGLFRGVCSRAVG